MKSRRHVLRLLGAAALCAPFTCLAQAQQAKVARIGFLGPTSATGIANRLEAFRAGLRELGYVEGKNLVIEFRWAEEKYDRLPELAAELVRLRVDLIVTHALVGGRAARQATTAIPIVVASAPDLVTSGLVASEARPGGNVTGLSNFSAELSAKRLELLKEVFPRIQRVAVLLYRGDSRALRLMEAGAATLKLELQPFGVRSPGEFESAFAAMSKQRVEAVAILEDTMIIANLAAAVSLAARHRIPSVGFVEVAEAGGLMAYGVNVPAMYRRAAVFVDKILKGAKPGDLPIERATTFDLVINQKAAKALGVTIQQSLLLRADRVIE